MAAIALLLVVLGARIQDSGGTSPRDPRIEQAATLLQHGRPSAALELYQTILSLDAANAEAQQGVVEASERMALDARAHEDSDTALRLLLSAQALVPGSPKLLYDLAVIEDGMKLYADADQNVARLASLTGLDDPKVLYLAARIKLDLGQLDLAEKQMRAYLRSSPEDAGAHYGLGRILQLAERLDEAKAEFLRSLELQPRQTEAYYQLGEIALVQMHYDDALSEFAKTLARNRSHGGALTGTGIVYFRLKSYEKAVAALRTAVEASPSYETAHYYLGLSLSRLGRKEESDRELARTAELAAADNQRDAQRLRIIESSSRTSVPTPAPPQ